MPKIGAEKNKLVNARQKRWRDSKPKGYLLARQRNSRRRFIYGLTPEQFDDLLASQGDLCAVCKSDNRENKRDWHIDHDHTIGPKAVRGVLCHHCNTMIGLARDNPNILRAAALYLENNQC